MSKYREVFDEEEAHVQTHFERTIRRLEDDVKHKYIAKRRAKCQFSLACATRAHAQAVHALLQFEMGVAK
jgi:hypothetical protein